jgi:hypothetical protein
MKKIDLGAIAAAPSTAASKHPIVTPDGDMAALLEQFGIINPQFKRLENQSKTLSKQLAAPIRGLYLPHLCRRRAFQFDHAGRCWRSDHQVDHEERLLEAMRE